MFSKLMRRMDDRQFITWLVKRLEANEYVPIAAWQRFAEWQFNRPSSTQVKKGQPIKEV